MEKFLRSISELTKNEFVKVENGVCTKLSDGTIIEAKDMMYWKMVADGYYSIGKHNCGRDDCDIGKPPQRCIDSRHYSKIGKCCVWGLSKITEDSHFLLSFSDIKKIL